MGNMQLNTSASNPTKYIIDMQVQIRNVLLHVARNLNISREAMMKQYNKNVRFFDYHTGDQAWLKPHNYKPGENKKLSPCNTGPWTIIEKCQNGVNFRITNERHRHKLVHHDSLVPWVKQDVSHDETLMKSPPGDEKASPSRHDINDLSSGSSTSDTDADSIIEPVSTQR